MSKVDIANGAAVTVALALAALVMLPGGAPPVPRVRAAADSGLVTLPNGEPALLDATGYPVPLREYRHIIGGSPIARELLLALAEPDRIAAVVDYGLEELDDGYRFAGIPRLASATELEAVLALEPDLVLLHSHGDPARAARLREAGVAVFDLGQMRGTADLLPNSRQVATLLGAPQRGERLARQVARRLAAVAADIPSAERREAIYVSIYGDRLFGGTVGSSFHEVLQAAGLRDAAAGKYHGWPQYSSEDLLMLDPDYIIVTEGMAASLCAHPGLQRLKACADGRGVIEVPTLMLTSAGAAMIDAAEAVRQAVYGTRAP